MHARVVARPEQRGQFVALDPAGECRQHGEQLVRPLAHERQRAALELAHHGTEQAQFDVNLFRRESAPHHERIERSPRRRADRGRVARASPHLHGGPGPVACSRRRMSAWGPACSGILLQRLLQRLHRHVVRRRGELHARVGTPCVDLRRAAVALGHHPQEARRGFELPVEVLDLARGGVAVGRGRLAAVEQADLARAAPPAGPASRGHRGASRPRWRPRAAP